ncbi:unnamed protein product [Effrenium voratum]|uniref:Uncharacterized protein n=1 Tax=Effrenium voratum TaxID=2562239 RepID=A0AA36I1C4_9DINO|nr:unnamed protein product [Effrenium voratum]
MRVAREESRAWLPRANEPCSYTVSGGLVLWLLSLCCVGITLSSVIAVKNCKEHCGTGCMDAAGYDVACHGKGQACFDLCRLQRRSMTAEQDCIESSKCVDTAAAEYAKAKACEEAEKCAEQGFLGTGPGFLVMFAVASILPVASTVCMGLFKEAFRWDAATLKSMTFFDGCGRLIWILGAALTVYVAYLLIDTYSDTTRRGAAFLGTVASAFALAVNCCACGFMWIARWCMSSEYQPLPR